MAVVTIRKLEASLVQIITAALGRAGEDRLAGPGSPVHSRPVGQLLYTGHTGGGHDRAV